MREPLKRTRGHIHIIAVIVVVAIFAGLISGAHYIDRAWDFQNRVTQLERRVNQLERKVEILEHR